MSQTRLELKVGLFVLLCLGLLAVLLLQFSKGVTLFRHTYSIVLNTGNIGGLRARASVLMSGVQIGTVSQTLLSPQGTNVSIHLKIYSQYVIRDDAAFKIEQSGFLGDQYVAIYPGPNEGQPLKDGAEVHAQKPLNLQEVASDINETIKEVKRVVLNEKTLTNLAIALNNFRSFSEEGLITVSNLNKLVDANGPSASAALSNFKAFSVQLKDIAAHADGILDTNAPQIALAISNLQASSAMLTNLLGEVQAGKGLAGALVNNQTMARDIARVANNLSVTTSNLNRLGLWHFLFYKPKSIAAPPPSRVTGHNP